jgi:hypothetical protein
MPTYKTADRVFETSATTGAGDYDLDGAPIGFQPFAGALGANNLCPYFAEDGVNWEAGIGTVLTGPARLARTVILSSSNGGLAVNWGAGTKNVRCGLPAALAVPRQLSKSVAGGVNVTLTQDEQRREVLKFTGALTANISVIVDETIWAWDVHNATSGAFTLTLKTNAGAGVAVPQGGRNRLYCDGVDVLPVIPSTSAKGDLLVGGAVGVLQRKAVGANGLTLVADSAQADGLVWGTPAQITVRQTVRLGAVDSSGYASFLGAGAGLNFNIDASPTPLVIDFAAGAADFTATISADASNQGALSASNTNYVHATYVSGSSVTWGSSLVPPQYGYAFDRASGALLNFNGTDASTTMLDDFGNTWTAGGNAQLDTAQFKFGASSLLLDGTGDYVRTTNIVSLGDGSWEMSVWFRFAALPAAGNDACLIKAANASAVGVNLSIGDVGAGVFKTRLWLASASGSWDIASAVAGTNTTWTLNQWNKVRLVFDALAGTYRVYLSLNGAAETQDTTVSSTARICAFTSLTLGATESAVAPFNGWLDAFSLVRCATKTGTETPSGSAPAITGYPYHWFSIPEMKMYEVTSASGSAGSNPGMTARNRVFVGEQDTNGSAVTASRTYALRGEYVSDEFAYALTTRTTRQHNIGVRPRIAHGRFINKTTHEGWTPGTEVVVHHVEIDSSANNRGAIVYATTRNVMDHVTSSQVLRLLNNGAGGGDMSTSSWKVQLYASRGW